MRTLPTELPPEIRREIQRRGLSAIVDEFSHREELSRDEMLYWKQLRALAEAEIQQPIDELSEVAEKAFRDDIDS